MTDVRVEVFGFSLSDSRHLLALRRGVPLLDREPTAVARELAGLGERSRSAPTHTLLHSTSWRHEHGQLVLTYAIAPDPAAHDVDGLWLTLESAVPSRPTSLTDPGRGSFTPNDVAQHACRHLAFLVRTDPVVSEASRVHPLLWAEILRHAPEVATLARFELSSASC